MKTKEAAQKAYREAYPDYMEVYRSSYINPHPSRRLVDGKQKDGWAFSFIVDYNGVEATATSVAVFETRKLAEQARGQFLLNQNALIKMGKSM